MQSWKELIELMGERGPSQVCVKTFSEGWVVGRRSNGRELYVVTDNKSRCDSS